MKLHNNTHVIAESVKKEIINEQGPFFFRHTILQVPQNQQYLFHTEFFFNQSYIDEKEFITIDINSASKKIENWFKTKMLKGEFNKIIKECSQPNFNISKQFKNFFNPDFYDLAFEDDNLGNIAFINNITKETEYIPYFNFGLLSYGASIGCGENIEEAKNNLLDIFFNTIPLNKIKFNSKIKYNNALLNKYKEAGYIPHIFSVENEFSFPLYCLIFQNLNSDGCLKNYKNKLNYCYLFCDENFEKGLERATFKILNEFSINTLEDLDIYTKLINMKETEFKETRKIDLEDYYYKTIEYETEKRFILISPRLLNYIYENLDGIKSLIQTNLNFLNGQKVLIDDFINNFYNATFLYPITFERTLINTNTSLSYIYFICNLAVQNRDYDFANFLLFEHNIIKFPSYRGSATGLMADMNYSYMKAYCVLNPLIKLFGIFILYKCNSQKSEEEIYENLSAFFIPEHMKVLRDALDKKEFYFPEQIYKKNENFTNFIKIFHKEIN